jgi:hypothetical protein
MKYTEEDTTLVWGLFTKLEHNSVRRISDITGIHIMKVRKIIDNKLKAKRKSL